MKNHLIIESMILILSYKLWFILSSWLHRMHLSNLWKNDIDTTAFQINKFAEQNGEPSCEKLLSTLTALSHSNDGLQFRKKNNFQKSHLMYYRKSQFCQGLFNKNLEMVHNGTFLKKAPLPQKQFASLRFNTILKLFLITFIIVFSFWKTLNF